MHNYNSYIAECLGTLCLVYVILSTGEPIAIAITLLLCIYVTKNISGGHLNPVVSFIQVINKKLSVNEFIPYIVSQGLGGLLAFELFKYI